MQRVEIQIKRAKTSKSSAPYSYQDLSSTVGDQWTIAQFKSPSDKHITLKSPLVEPLASYAVLSRERVAPVTLEEFAQQTGLDPVSILSFEVA